MTDKYKPTPAELAALEKMLGHKPSNHTLQYIKGLIKAPAEKKVTLH